MKERSL